MLGGGGDIAYAEQTEVKIAVLTADPEIEDAGALAAMQISKDDLNKEYESINATVTLRVIDVSDYGTNPGSVAQKIDAALQEGFRHFIGPSNFFTLIPLKGIIHGNAQMQGLSPDSIIISPASSFTHPFLTADDNLFRLVPNGNTLALQMTDSFDRYGTTKVLLVAPPSGVEDVSVLPKAVRDYFVPSPIVEYPGPQGSYESNLRAATEIHNRLESLISQYGSDKAGILLGAPPAHYAHLVKILADNPHLDSPGKARWYGFESLINSDVTVADPVVAEFSANVQMSINLYEIQPNDVNRILSTLPNPGAMHIITANYAAYDAVHLLADSIVLGGADNPNLKEFIFEVSDGTHALEHATRLLGQGAMGDYKLDRQTGDLIEGGSYVEHRVVSADDGGYVWAEIFHDAPMVCR